MKWWANKALALLLIVLAGTVRAETVINIAVTSSGSDLALMQAAADRYGRVHPGVTVRLLRMPELTDDRFDLVKNFLELQSPELDIIQLDIVWISELAPHLLELNEAGLGYTASLHEPELLQGNTIDGRLVALPWSNQIGLLYSRADLLEQHGFSAPPSDWDELERMARHIQEQERASGHDSFWGFVWQGAPYEGLTVNAVEWLASTGAGTIVEPDYAVVSIGNQRAARMIERVRSWIGEISPPAVLDFTEADALAQMQSGNAAFLRSWPSTWTALQTDPQVQGRITVSAIPSDGNVAAGVRGGASIGISRYSRNSELATDVLSFLTTEHEQAHRAMHGGMAPTRSALYSDPEVLASMPFLASLRNHFVHAVERPSLVTGSEYSRVSRLFHNTVHYLLAGSSDIESTLATLADSLQGILRMPAGPPSP